MKKIYLCYRNVFSRLLQKFLGDTKTVYEAELETVDFISNADAARLNINTWVEKQTQGANTSFTSGKMKQNHLYCKLIFYNYNETNNLLKN